MLTWLCASPVLLNLVWAWQGCHSPSVLSLLPWCRYFNQVSRYNKIPIDALQATRQGQCKSQGITKFLLTHYRPHVGANANSAKSHYRRDSRSIASTTLYSFQSHCRSLVLTGSCPRIPDEPPIRALCCGVRCVVLVWACGVVRPRRRERSGHLSGCLGDFVGSSPSLPLPQGPFVSWTASVEPGRWHPTAFLTTRTFYGGDSGSLRSSDLAVSSFVRRSSYLLSVSLPAPLSRNPAFQSQRTSS